MPPAKKTASRPPALTDSDVAELRSRVKSGETPRVVVRVASAAVPAGTRGNIVRVGNPSDGEFVVVRLGKDEVPFAPSELGLPGRKAVVPATTPAKSTPAAKGAAPARTTAVAKKRSGSPRRTPPPLSVMLRFADGRWTVEASRGARRLAKAAPVRPGAVKAFADHLDDINVREAIVDTIESCRSVVEERAAALRAELNAAEAVLKEYDARRR